MLAPQAVERRKGDRRKTDRRERSRELAAHETQSMEIRETLQAHTMTLQKLLDELREKIDE